MHEGGRFRRPGQAQGCVARGPVVVLRHPLCEGARRRAAVATTGAGRGVGRDPGRIDLRPHRAAVGRRAWHHEPRRPRDVGTAQRGLPLAQRLDPRTSGDLHRGARRGRPVMVFIHGGGFTSGSGSVFLYRGGNLVRNGDAVVVTINYRLGALGFLGHREPGRPGRPRRELGHPRPTGCAGLGARQHRRLRRRSRQRHHLRRVGRRLSAWPRCSARPPPRGSSAGPWCRAGGCTCTRSKKRSVRQSAWRRCWVSSRATERLIGGGPGLRARRRHRGDRPGAVRTRG